MKALTPLFALVLAGLSAAAAAAQEAQPILSYFVDATGRARVQVASAPDAYHVLFVRDSLPDGAERAVGMALGAEGNVTLTEGLAAFPKEHYRVQRYSLAAPADQDGDGIDDVTEFKALGRMAPFNASAAIDIANGTVAIPDRATFETLSYQGQEVLIDTHLKDLEFVKFYILDANTQNPKVYYMNTVTHRSHGSFSRAVGLPGGGRPGGQSGQMRGEIVYHPHVPNRSGGMGIYRFEFEPNDNYPFASVRLGYEILARGIPFLENNWYYYPMPQAALPRYQQEKALYDASRVQVVLDKDLFANTQYIALNLAEGYGLLTVMEDPNARPNPRDIVIYEALPNEMPRVGGIITTVPQTPLSHVNLRAIQDGVPNAYIAGALENETIKALIGKHVHYRVAADAYQIREASLAEVEAFHAARRPSQPQVPARDLSVTGIADLDSIGFADWRSYGVKAANVAAMRRFGFPEGTVPDGFAVPFYFYDAFMVHNGFYDKVRALLADPTFQADYDVQEARLKELRKEIEKAEMPDWMLEALATMQAGFVPDQPIRCRSSTNNEDLPGFSGAGLYDSYTHQTDEGHIAKSIKQVYASTWTFRAFDERQFYRVDHFTTAMGVLVHANYENEAANGVGVTTDPIYRSVNTYYLNTQVGENLVTNPDALSVPEEILLGVTAGSGYTIVRPSNQVPAGQQVLSPEHLESMRRYLGVILSEFKALYGEEDNPAFAMEVEYKITAEDVLEFKQARPWVNESAAVEPGATPTASPVGPTRMPTTRPTTMPTARPTEGGKPGYRVWLPRLGRG